MGPVYTLPLHIKMVRIIPRDLKHENVLYPVHEDIRENIFSHSNNMAQASVVNAFRSIKNRFTQWIVFNTENISLIQCSANIFQSCAVLNVILHTFGCVYCKVSVMLICPLILFRYTLMFHLLSTVGTSFKKQPWSFFCVFAGCCSGPGI